MAASTPSDAAISAGRIRDPLSERELIALMAMLMSLQAFGIDSMLPALGQIATELGAGGNDRQLVIGTYFLGGGIGALFPGAFADRFGRRKVLAVALVSYIVFSLACALVTDFTLLLALRFLMGLSCAGLAVVPVAIVRDRMGGDRMARMMSQIMMVFLLVPMLAPAVGQAILFFADWRAIFAAMAIVGLAVGVWVWVRLPETLVPENRQAIDPRTIGRNMITSLTDRLAIGYVLGSAMIFGAMIGFLTSSQQLIAESFGASDNFVLIFGAAIFGMVVANFANAKIVERFGARRVSHAALFILLGSGTAMYASASNQPQQLWEFVVLMSLSMAMVGFIAANFSSIALQPFQQIAGAASSAQQSLRMCIGSILGAFIGNAFDGTAIPLGTAMFVCALLSLFVVLYSERGKLFGRRIPSA